MKMAALVDKSLGMCLRMLWKVLTKFSTIFEYAYANYNSFFNLLWRIAFQKQIFINTYYMYIINIY